MPDLLIELLSEEIPARMQTRAAEDFKRLMTDGLVDAGLTYASAAAFSTPRRMALTVEDLLAESPTLREERKGPRTDAPEKALEGFLRATGLTRDQLETRDDKKGQVWFATVEKPGRPAAEIVAEVLGVTIRAFPWPKSMRWGDGDLRWVRPLHGIVAILSDTDGRSVVPFKIDGIAASDRTTGHRFMAPNSFSVASFDDYTAKLKRAKVILSAEERAAHIQTDADTLAFAQGLEIVPDPALLREVAGLVEWPVVLMGEIEDQFRALPPEVLQTSMREHQKFFSVRNPKTDRIENFITVANRDTADNGSTILAGNQKVLAARLADARFFWANDLRVAEDGLAAWKDGLDSVTFHNLLGTQGQRIARIAELSRVLAPQTGADPKAARTAAELAKCDLASEMVYEFPELQGVMGSYYVAASGQPADIAAVAREHYQPLGPSDDVPSAPLSVAVALADKLDSLSGFWAIDEKPTGSKDPFALRRAALGVIRLILENGLRLNLATLFDRQLLVHKTALARAKASPEEIDTLEELLEEIGAHGVFGAAYLAVADRLEGGAGEVVEGINASLPDKSSDLLSFFHDRLKVYLKDRGIRHDVIDACLAMPGGDDLTLLVKRAEALNAVLQTDDGANLLQAFKRANNILTQAEEKDGVEYSYGPDAKFAEGDEETAVFAALDTAETEIAAAMATEDFAAAMGAMAGMRGPIDRFFETVQINTDNAILRRNRLNLLSRIRTVCGSVADLTRIEG